MRMTLIYTLVTLLVTESCWFLTVLCKSSVTRPLTNDRLQLTLDESSDLALSTFWQVLGPFQSGTREAAWGADPLERYGGFRNLSYDPNVSFSSALAVNGCIKWSTVQADISSTSHGHAKASLNVSFPHIDWIFLQSIYGWSALQYQAWARGSLTVSGPDACTVALFTDGLPEMWVDKRQYFGGDYYRYRRAPIILYLHPGRHVIDLRLVRDVRSVGGVGEPRIEVVIEAKACHEYVDVDVNSLLLSEVTQGKLASPLGSINIRNNMAQWAEILWIRFDDKPQHEIHMEGEALRLAPFQTRPLIFSIVLGQPLSLEFSLEIAYRFREDTQIFTTRPFTVTLMERSILETVKLTFLHPAGVVSYAILRPPPTTQKCMALHGATALPVLLSLHGAGLEADSEQVRQMLDRAYGICAWILFPTGVTPWSGDDWHTWGTADIHAALAAIPSWIESAGFDGPKAALDDWIVIGHSNGGQGTWFISTHFPDKVIAAAPVSGYSSIESYVSYNMWQDSEPLVSSILQMSRSNFKHELLLENLAGIPVLQQHGSDDDNVPAYHSRLMHELMMKTGWPSQYNELPGKGHWFKGVMTTSALLKFYNETTSGLQLPSLPSIFSIVVPSSGDMGSKGGIFVDQLQSPDMHGHVKVTRDVETGTWYVKTKNIKRFHVWFEHIRADVPIALVLDDVEEAFAVNMDKHETTWYSRDYLGGWITSADGSWRGIHQRYGRQLGAMDAILRSSGSFKIRTCSSGSEHVALQISRNLFQYFAADSSIGGCSMSHHPFLTLENRGPEAGRGNVITVALGEELPPSKHATFPIHIHEHRLRLLRPRIYGNGDPIAHQDWQASQSAYKYHFDFEDGMGALFLRPLEDERLELVVWGADIAGLERAARLVPSFTGVGQPDFMVLSDSCRWKGHAGVYAAGFFDHSWQISSASYISGSTKYF